MIKDYKKDFPVYQKQPDLVYLDSAASSLKPQQTIDAIDHYYHDLGANVHRGAYDLAYESTRLYEESRATVAQFLHASEDEVIFTRGTTTALNMVARGYSNIIQPGDEIIVSELEHHSSLLPWMVIAKKRSAILKYVPLNHEGRITLEAFKSVLSNKTRVIALTMASNVLGYFTPIKDIVKAARKYHDIIIIADAAQAIMHEKIDVKDLDVDYLAFSGHKIFGPSGVGVLYGKKTLLDQLEPFEYGGEMVDQVFINDATFKSSPLRFEAGTPVISGAIGLKTALDYFNSIGYETIQNHVKQLVDFTKNELNKIEGLTLYNPQSDIGILAFNIDDIHPHDIASYLDSKKVSVRAGHHCAQLVSKWLNVVSTIRVSFGIYNTMDDCQKLIEALIEARDFFRKF